jgi:uncharacterized protein (DUF983 family)
MNALLLLKRGLCLQCANCGHFYYRGLRWNQRCPSCGLRLERGEGDHFLGSLAFNIVLSETLFIVGMLAAVYFTLPNPPWNMILYVGLAGCIMMPLLFMPLAKTLWLALDVWMRPVHADELRG